MNGIAATNNWAQKKNQNLSLFRLVCFGQNWSSNFFLPFLWSKKNQPAKTMNQPETHKQKLSSEFNDTVLTCVPTALA